MTATRFVLMISLVLATCGAGVWAQEGGGAKVDAAGKALLAAQGHYTARRYEMAADAYTAFLKEFPTDSRVTAARYGLGGCRYHLEQYDKAAAEMARVVEAKDFKQHNDALLVLGYCYLVQKEYDKAAAACKRLMTEAPKSTQALNAAIYRIQALFFGEKMAPCAAACDTFVGDHPTSPSRYIARYFQGQALRKLGKNAEAVTALAELTRQADDPRRVDAMILSAQCLRDLAQYDLAESMYRKMLKVAPTARQASGHYGLAVVLYDAGKYAEAIIECKAVLDVPKCPYAPAARFRLGLSQWADGKVADARKTFQAVISGDKTRAPKATYWLARCDMALGKHATAREALLELAKGKVDNAEQIAFDVAMCSLLGEEYEQAVTDFEAYRKAYPTGAHAVETLYRQAFCLHQLKKYAESQALCEKVAKAKPCSITGAAEELSAENLLLSGQYEAGEKAFAALAAAAAEAKDADREFGFNVRRGQCAHLAGKHAQAVQLLVPLAADKRLAEDETLREAMLQLGESLLALKQYDDAATTLQKYLKVARQHVAQAQCKLGLAYLRGDEKDKAADAFAKGMTGEAASPWVIRSAFEYGDLAYREGEKDKAAAALAKVLAAKDVPDDLAGGAAYLLAWIDHDAEKYAEAAKRFGEMAEKHPKHANAADATFQQGWCTMQAGKHEAALAMFQAYSKAHPEGASAIRARRMSAKCLVELGRHAEAAELYGTIAGDSKAVDADSLYGLAWSQRETKKDDEAVATYKRLIKEYPKSPLLAAARTELGNMLYLRKEYKAAAELLEAVLAETSAEARLLEAAGYQVGCCYEKMGDPVKTAAAMAAFAAGYPKHANTPSALYQAGAAQADLKKYDEAILHFATLVKNFPTHDLLANTYIKLGQVQNESQRYDEAAKTFGAYLAKFSDGTWAYMARFGMGWSLESRKKYPEARKWYALVEKTHDGETAARAKFQIGQTYFAEGNYTKAAAELISVDTVYAYKKWSAKALLEAGHAFEGAKDVKSARAQYALCIEKYPKTKEAAVAAEELKKLGNE